MKRFLMKLFRELLLAAITVAEKEARRQKSRVALQDVVKDADLVPEQRGSDNPQVPVEGSPERPLHLS